MNAVPDKRVETVREFNRLYTKVLGVLDERMLSTPYSLTEARVLFELSTREHMAVSALRKALGLDAGYLSRLLASFQAAGLVVRERSAEDGRQQIVALTAEGKELYRGLNEVANEHVRELIGGLTEENQRSLVRAMDVIRLHLGDRPRPETVVLRTPRPGDFGWVVHRHGAVYAQEFGWDESFEALTAGVVADYLAKHDPRRESAWIAEVHGEPAGSVFCVRKDEHTARLRLLLVEPSARGHGVGSRLVKECIAFARRAGYRVLELWTVDQLLPARRIYQHEGFRVVSKQRVHRFGTEVVGETWHLDLK